MAKQITKKVIRLYASTPKGKQAHELGQTPHARALEAALVAYCKATGLNPEHRKVLMVATEQSCEAYLTTLLDSPEMVERFSGAFRSFCLNLRDLQDSGGDGIEFVSALCNDYGKGIIAAIKKESGV
jgi:hypothetical protein